MLDNETWLLHSDVFKKHWIVESKNWARSLGWFSELHDSALDTDGWLLYGDHELQVSDYINIVDALDAEKKLYAYKDNNWTFIHGPILFTVRKNDNEVFVAGWAGEKNIIAELKEKENNPWQWPGIHTVEITPKIAMPVSQAIVPQKIQLPVFFVSNGETNAEENWHHLKRICPRAHRVENINGRRRMFQECATLAGAASHFFIVTGKNFVTDSTVFDFYPTSDVPKSHIVFQSRNMSNRLEYGHMAIVCYNTEVVLSTPETFGLDFTEYGTIHLIPKTVSEGHFATTPFEAWRTAFRETVKLTMRDNQEQSKQWLKRWLSFAEGAHSEWVLLGAQQGHEYALQHRGNIEELLKTVDWNWLSEYFHKTAQVVSI